MDTHHKLRHPKFPLEIIPGLVTMHPFPRLIELLCYIKNFNFNYHCVCNKLKESSSYPKGSELNH